MPGLHSRSAASPALKRWATFSRPIWLKPVGAKSDLPLLAFGFANLCLDRLRLRLLSSAAAWPMRASLKSNGPEQAKHMKTTLKTMESDEAMNQETSAAGFIRTARQKAAAIWLCAGLLMLLWTGRAVAGTNDGLVAWYPFDGNANDASENGHNGSSFGGVSYVPGVVGQAAYFNGTSTYITVPNSPEFEPGTGPMSVAVWMKIPSDWNSWVTAWISVADPNYPYTWISLHAISPNAGFQLKSGTSPSQTQLNGPAVNDGKWHHLAGVRMNQTTIRLYFDGVLVGELSNPSLGNVNTFSTNPIYIGWNPAYDAIHTKGAFDDLRIYNRALSASEVRELAGFAPLDADPSLVAWYPFDGNANDASANGNNATSTALVYTNGVVAQAGVFNGTSSKAVVAHTSSLNFGTSSFSVGCWLSARAKTNSDFRLGRWCSSRQVERHVDRVEWS
jgi:hypothetical protein